SASTSVNDPQDRQDLVEIHHCVKEILANLNVEGVEFFLDLDGETLKLTLQTKKFLEAQDLAVDLGKKIEQIAAADIHRLAVYKRKTAETNAFLIKEMALSNSDIPIDEAEESEISTLIANPNQSRNTSFKDASEFEFKPKLRTYGLLTSYLLRLVSAIFALGVGIGGVYGISRFFDNMEQKPITYLDVNQLPGMKTGMNDAEVIEYQVVFNRGTHMSGFFIYIPTHPAKSKIPCIFVAPSGTTPLYGQKLEPMRREEYIEYIKAGYAVMAYDVDGAIQDMSKANEEPLLRDPDKIVTYRLKEHKASDGGVLNTKLAIDYAIARIPQIDPNAIYTGGTGSGGTIALMAAAADNRVKGAIVFNPVTDIPKKFPRLIENISKVVTRYPEAIERFSPYQNALKINKPLFIFQDDISTMNSAEDTNSFIELVSKSNSAVTFFHTPVPPDFRYTIQPPAGNKQSIEWLNSQQKN
ncbi:hypothetical protein, partial [Chamaesiphon sp. VAR_69_metabat_338]|uniref:alpha/beta hydrolase family protein n=1 Tax=Chamaesiphon sp. VAR_69_metabat_338 TaxID=2964704 RepID=UPI00286DD548